VWLFEDMVVFLLLLMVLVHQEVVVNWRDLFCRKKRVGLMGFGDRKMGGDLFVVVQNILLELFH